MSVTESELSEETIDSSSYAGVMAQMIAWQSFIEHAIKAKTAQPSERYLRILNEHIDVIGEEAVLHAAFRWFDEFVSPPRADEIREFPRLTSFVSTQDEHANLLRGLVWCCIGKDDPKVSRAVANLTEAALKKIPGRGARSQKLGSAGSYALSTMPGMHATIQLGKLRQRVVNAQAIRGFEHELNRRAARMGISRDDLDDLLTPTFDLVEGRRHFDFAPYSAVLSIGGPSGVEIAWFDAGDKPRRSEPKEVKERHPQERAELKKIADDLRKTLSAQKSRIEGLYLADRHWPLETWRERYLDHPLISQIVRRLIWSFETEGVEQTGAWLEGQVVDADDKPLLGLTAETHVRLWHPLGAVFPLVAAWREWLERHRVRQPFKQAHREIYVLTDAERTTATYSNRFAAHIIRQHQFRALAQARSWSYQLGVMDSWVVPTLELPKHRLRVEFFVDDIDVMDRSPSGIPLYIATDQVRFLRPGLAEPRRRREPDVALPLDEIPALIFSEVMRDVDLFVGVASVGADPTWADHGPEAIRAYWSDFAFGELSESAKTRRAVLERLIPRLAIAPRCSLEERALVVRGDLRTYRIHLGSGNIQMEPNNEYLCIVPERGGKAEKSDLFLPFEGDGMLSTIISKAILLSNDRAITDPTIVRQITRAINAEQIRALANDATARTR